MASIHFKKKLIHQCTIQRNTPVQSTSGELIDSWADVDTVDCRFVQKTETIAQESLSFQMLESPMMLMNAGEDVQEEDRIIDIVWKSDGSNLDTGPYTIESLLMRSTSSAHHLSLLLERIE